MSTSLIERNVEVASNRCILRGTLCLPSDLGRFPSVLMVYGTGPVDRNENVKGCRIDIFNTLAHHLAGIGIASLRYDKRGCGESSGDYYSAGYTDLVGDAIKCFDALGEYGSCVRDQLFILGHSEGCLIGAQVCVLRPKMAGLIL